MKSIVRKIRKIVKEYIDFRNIIQKKGDNIFSVFPHYVCFYVNQKRYNITMVDYFELTFYKKTKEEKEELLNTNEQRVFAHTVDNVEKGLEFTYKTFLYSLFKKQMGRRQLFTENMTKDDFLDFVKENNTFLFKPDFSWCGTGIRKIDINDYKSLDALYDELKQEKGVLDEFIIQHIEMKKLNPETLNSIRVFSIRINDEIRIFAAALRMGRKNAVVDNYSAGGVVGSINVDTGTIIDLGEDMYGNRYEKHPDTGVVLVGFKIPNWDKVIELVTECAEISPINYVGWDVAIKENDCLLIEGNFNPMVNVVQIAGGGGKKKLYQKLLQEFKESKILKS